VFDPTRYTVLTASQMTKERYELVTSVLKTVTTGPEAMTLPERPGWSCIVADRNAGNGRVLIVSYLGTEVALFFKRQLTEIIPESGEKMPEGVLQDPKEAWQRLDLLGRSADQSNFVITQQHRRLEESNRLHSSRASDLDDLNDDLTSRLAVSIQQNRKLMTQKADLEKQLRLAQRSVRELSRPSKPTPKQKKLLKKPGKRGKQYSRNAAFLKAQRKKRKKEIYCIECSAFIKGKPVIVDGETYCNDCKGPS
jgi:hypothetical protein